MICVTRKSLPPPEKHGHEFREQQASMITSGGFLLSTDGFTASYQKMYQHQIAIITTSEAPLIHNCEPSVEMPPSPEYEYKEAPSEHEDFYEDYLCDLEDIVLGVQYDVEIDLYSSKHVLNNISWTPNCGKDLAVIDPHCSFGQNKRLKNISRLRMEHHA